MIFRVVECYLLEKFSLPQHAILCICNANLTFFVCSPYYRSWEGCLAPFLASKMPLWVETGGVLLSRAPPLPSVEMMMKTLDAMMTKTLDEH